MDVRVRLRSKPATPPSRAVLNRPDSVYAPNRREGARAPIGFMATAAAPHIALSCAVSDRAVAQDIAAALEAAGYRVAPIEMGPTQVAETYGAAPAVLVIWSSASAASKWVSQEARQALARNGLVEISLQPVRGDAPPAALAPISFDGWDGQAAHPAMKELRKRLRPIIGAAKGKRVSVTQATPWALGAVVVMASVVAVAASLATRAPATAAQQAPPPARSIITTGPIEGAPDPAALPKDLPTAAPLRTVASSKSELNRSLQPAPLETTVPGDRDRGYSREDIAALKARRAGRAKPAETAEDEAPVSGPPM
jgi:hypothetical protein